MRFARLLSSLESTMFHGNIHCIRTSEPEVICYSLDRMRCINVAAVVVAGVI